jgi:hypothetical protein
MEQAIANSMKRKGKDFTLTPFDLFHLGNEKQPNQDPHVDKKTKYEGRK